MVTFSGNLKTFFYLKLSTFLSIFFIYLQIDTLPEAYLQTMLDVFEKKRPNKQGYKYQSEFENIIFYLRNFWKTVNTKHRFSKLWYWQSNIKNMKVSKYFHGWLTCIFDYCSSLKILQENMWWFIFSILRNFQRFWFKVC